jgi:hypothetical protein
MSERRASTRKPLHVRAVMVYGGRQMEAKVLDISDGGVTLQSTVNMPSGSPLSVAFTVRTGTGYSIVQAECQVIHTVCGAGGIGFKSGLRFVEVNRADQEAIAACMAY